MSTKSLSISERYTIKKSYFIAGVSFDTIEEYISLKKRIPGIKVEDVEKFFIKKVMLEDGTKILNEDATPVSTLHELWGRIPAMTDDEIIERYKNSPEQLKKALEQKNIILGEA